MLVFHSVLIIIARQPQPPVLTLYIELIVFRETVVLNTLVPIRSAETEPVPLTEALAITLFILFCDKVKPFALFRFMPRATLVNVALPTN